MSTTVPASTIRDDIAAARARRAPAPITAPVAKTPRSDCCRSTSSAASPSPACCSSTIRARGARSIRRSSTRRGTAGRRPISSFRSSCSSSASRRTSRSTARRARGDDERGHPQPDHPPRPADLPARLPRERVPVLHVGNDAPASPIRPFLQRVVDRLYHWRIMGVLQRIGLAYMCAALLTQGRTVKQQVDHDRHAALRLLVRDDAAPRAGTRHDGPARHRRRAPHDGRLVGSSPARLVALRTREPHLGRAA